MKRRLKTEPLIVKSDGLKQLAQISIKIKVIENEKVQTFDE